MVNFMTKDSGQEVLSLDDPFFTVQIYSSNGNSIRSCYFFVHSRDGEASFFEDGFSFLVKNFGIGEYDQILAVFSHREVYSDQLDSLVHLRCCQPNTRSRMHGFDHAAGQFANFLIDVGDYFRFSSEYWISDGHDF